MSDPPIHILLVEDDDSHAELVQLCFEQCRLKNQINRVQTGIEAIAYLRGEGDHADSPSPDLVLLDIGMPGPDGFDVLAAIREEMRTDIRVVILTASRSGQARTRARSAACDAYVVKPLDSSKVFQMIEDLGWHLWLVKGTNSHLTNSHEMPGATRTAI